jgi:hypothetical protein
MAKQAKPKKENSSRGRSKAAGRTARTIANKERKVATRTARLLRAAERREKDTYTVPLDAMVPVSSLPKRAQAKYRSLVENFGNDVMVPDPKRGMRITRGGSHEILARRKAQAARVSKKRRQRQNFRALSPKVRAERREAGRNHAKPSDLAKAGK